ncbi:alternate-type signal peptide domain-containing protein [Microbacterium rhizophilus]|uniref:alternate-type signal peptide domain-containing protein n=1 Tax=Microbacterium rhizophilus TaxID=3138934 RepID=UPI0031EF2BCF
MDTNGATVIVTEERKRRRGLIWVGLGAVALLSGGSTFALWSATDAFAGGDITAGDLNLVNAADTAFYDVTPGRADGKAEIPGTDGSQPGHTIDDGTWRIVPGDIVAAAFTADVTLEGDNLVGRLAIDGLDESALANTGMTYTYEIYQAGTKLIDETALPATGDATLLYLSAPQTGQEAGVQDADGTTVYAMADETEEITVVVYGEFDEATAGRDQATVTDTLAGTALTLEQVRDTGTQFE